MSTQLDKAQALAEKITKVAEDGLGPLERLTHSPGWTPEFRAIMWGAVEHLALKRKIDAEQSAREEGK